MFKETLGAAVLGMTLASAPGTATAAPQGAAPASSAAAEAAAAARRDALTVRIDTDRRRGRGLIEIRVREADDRERVRGALACLRARDWGGWRTVDCERTDRRGEADWVVRSHRRTFYQIFIPGNREYYPYYSDTFRIRGHRNWWDEGRNHGRDDDRRR